MSLWLSTAWLCQGTVCRQSQQWRVRSVVYRQYAKNADADPGFQTSRVRGTAHAGWRLQPMSRGTDIIRRLSDNTLHVQFHITIHMKIRVCASYGHNLRDLAPGLANLPTEILGMIHDYAMANAVTSKLPGMTVRLRSVCRSFRSAMQHSTIVLCPASPVFASFVRHCQSERTIADEVRTLYIEQDPRQAVDNDNEELNNQLWKNELLVLTVLLPKLHRLECRAPVDQLNLICSQLKASKIVEIRWSALKETGVCKLLSTWPALESLQVGTVSVPAPQLFGTAEFPCLRSLCLSGASTALIEEILSRKLPALTTLGLPFPLTGLTQATLAKYMPSLLELHVQPGPEGFDVDSLSEFINACASLCTLDIGFWSQPGSIPFNFESLFKHWSSADWSIRKLVVANDWSQTPTSLISQMRTWSSRIRLEHVLFRAPRNARLEWKYTSLIEFAAVCRLSEIGLSVGGDYGHLQVVSV